LASVDEQPRSQIRSFDHPFLARIGPDPGRIHLAHPLKHRRFAKLF
jgi:hypothetical protein